MAHRIKEGVSGQVQSQLVELEDSQGLPFRELLSAQRILDALNRAGVKFRYRIFDPVITLWAFLSQVTAGKDATCEKAVARVLVDRVLRKQPRCSPETTSYCEARCRLPEKVIVDLARETGQNLHRQAPADWLWNGRNVAIVDGTTCLAADTEANQAEYPQSKNQKRGLGFPILRIVVLLSLSVGTALECAIGPCRGKKTGEQSLFRQMWETLKSGDIVLGDRLYDAYRDIVLLHAGGIDTVFGKKQSRRIDFRSGRKLGHDDHIVVWQRPKYDASRFASKAEWESLPETQEMREVRTTIRRKGYRTRTIVIVTTLLDEQRYSAKDLMNLFAMRWHCELDLRSIKQSLGMNYLRCKTPEMVRKEIWAYLLAYNLIRVRMAQAAAVHGRLPRTLSFTSAQTLIDEFALALRHARGAEAERLEAELLIAIAHSRVGNRPGRKEPRAVKKRDQTHKHLTKPRAEARKGLPA